MANILKIAVLAKDGQDFSGNTVLRKTTFNTDKISHIAHGFWTPYKDNGLGATTSIGYFAEQSTAPASNSVNATSISYFNNSIIENFVVSCDSASFETALESTDVQNFVSLAVATGSGYTAQV